MPGCHRNGDSRFCGADTIVQNQSTVFVNNKLWAVEGDPEHHGEGRLIAVYGAKNVYINNKLVICAVGDKAGGDLAGHPAPPTDPSQASGDTYVYENADAAIP